MQAVPEVLRGGDLAALAAILERQQVRKVDAVVPASAVSVADGGLVVAGFDALVDENGVTAVDSHLTIGDGALGDLANRYKVPVDYLRRCQATAVGLFDANINEWIGRDGGSMFLRTFTDPEGGDGFARAVLSDRFRVIDHLDVLYAALDGARATGLDIQVDSVDLTERAMRVRFVAPAIQVLAPDLMRGYRAPWGGGVGPAPWEREGGRAHGWYTPDDAPVLYAGIELSNSETGVGAFSLAPRLIVQICRNGLVIRADALRAVHLGQKLEAGVIRWSADTVKANADLVRAQTGDAIRTFLDVDYMRTVLNRIEAQAGRPVAKPVETIETVAAKLRYTETEREGLLAHFVAGGQLTAGGVMAAVTSLAQTIADPDRAAEIEGGALDALALAAA